MVYKLIAYNLEDDGERISDEFDLTDDSGRTFYFPSKKTAKLFAYKYGENFLYDEYVDYEIDVDSEDRNYTNKDAEHLIEFILEV